MDNFIIAEAGSNHNGDIQKALDLIDIAYKAKADSIKFQLIFADGLYLPEYPAGGAYIKSKVFEKRLKEEFTSEEWFTIWNYAREVGIDISGSVFCSRGVSLLKELGCTYVKIASTDLTNHKLIREVCTSFDTVVMSTGMASIQEVSASVACAMAANVNVNLKLMHCVSLYPCRFEEAKISRINALKSAFNIEVGYSDHTNDARSAILAWANGATFFEKHFTYDKDQPGFDHAHAQSPEELGLYIETLKSCEQAMQWCELYGDNQNAENVTKIRARRGVYVNKDLLAGHVITKDDLLYVRPSSEYQSVNPSDFVGLKIMKPLIKYSAIGMNSEIVEVSSNWAKADTYWNQEMKEKNMDDD